MLDAVFLAESMDHANWDAMGQLAERCPRATSDAFRSRRRRGRARGRRAPRLGAGDAGQVVMLQAESRAMTATGAKVEEIVEKIKGWLPD